MARRTESHGSSVFSGAFSPASIEVLRRALGKDALAQVLPELEKAVVLQPRMENLNTATKRERREKGRKHARVAKKIKRQTQTLLHLLDEGDKLYTEAISLGFLLPGTPDTSTIALGDLFSFCTARRSVSGLLRQANEWASRAQRNAGARRGRTVGLRRYLGASVAYALEQAGVRLTRSANGKLARVLIEVYEAARVPVPLKMDREAAEVLDLLRSSPPPEIDAPSS